MGDKSILIVEERSVEIIQEGAQGIAGPPGVADIHYVHNQIAAATEWNVVHNLGKMPSVTVVDSGNNVVVGDVEYLSTTSLRLTFSALFSGKAYLN